MGFILDTLKYSPARNLSKAILVVSALAISTFATSIPRLDAILQFDAILQIRNWIALSLIFIWFFIREDLLVPKKLGMLDRTLSKVVYYSLLFLIAIGISTISFSLLDGILNFSLFGYVLLTVRNLVAVALLFSARIIHVST